MVAPLLVSSFVWNEGRPQGYRGRLSFFSFESRTAVEKG